MTKIDIRTGALNATGLGEYPQGAREAAELADCAFIDLNAMSIKLVEALGPDAARKAYVDGLHTNTYGGYLLARCVAEGIREAKLPLAEYLLPDAKFDLAHPAPLPDAYDIPADPPVRVPDPPGWPRR